MPRRRSQASLCCARFVKLPKVSAVYKRQLKAITFPVVDHLSESAGTKEGLCCFSPDGSKQQSNVCMCRKVYGVYVFAISNNRLSEHFSSILGHRAATWIHSVMECTFTFPQVSLISFILRYLYSSRSVCCTQLLLLVLLLCLLAVGKPPSLFEWPCLRSVPTTEAARCSSWSTLRLQMNIHPSII